MREDDLLEIYRRIAMGKDEHGGFVTAFAGALIKADEENFQLMLPLAYVFAHKYKLAPAEERHD